MTAVFDVMVLALNDYLLTNQRERRNLLAAGIDADDTILTFVHPLKTIQEGACLSIALEDMYVVDVNTQAQTATVIRADKGTTASAHTTAEQVSVNARVTLAGLLRAMRSELDALSAEGLFQMKAENITYNSAVRGYELTDATAIDVWEVRADTSGPESDWPAVPFRWEHKMPTTGTHSFASGIMVVPEGGESGRSIRVWYKAPFTTTGLDSLVDDVTTVSGLHAEAMDLLALGMALQVTAGAAIRRARPDTQGDTRRGEEVTVNDALQSPRGLMALRDRRLNAEISRLNRMYPPRVWTRRL
jgi:hypothetical protein